MQLLHGISIGDVEFIALSGLKVKSGFPVGPRSVAEANAFKGKSQAMLNFPPDLQADTAAHRRRARVFWVMRPRSLCEQTTGLVVTHFVTFHVIHLR